MNFNICILAPDDQPNTLAYLETVQLIHYSLIELGHSCQVGINTINKYSQNIVFGYLGLTIDFINKFPNDQIPHGTIFFNTEPIYNEENNNKKESLFAILKNYEVWDYSPVNYNYLIESGFPNVKLFKFGYQAQLNRVPKSGKQDIDVLFYGLMNDRRYHIIRELNKKGITAEAITGTYEKERDLYISRSKLILNVYYFNAKTFDVIRNFYLMSNAKAVVSEEDENFPIPSEYRNGICSAPYDDIVNACITLLNNDSLRCELESKALTTIQALPQAAFTQELI